MSYFLKKLAIYPKHYKDSNELCTSVILGQIGLSFNFCFKVHFWESE